MLAWSGFQIKAKLYEPVVRFTARMVIQGFLQVEDRDFTETFAPVVKFWLFVCVNNRKHLLTSKKSILQEIFGDFDFNCIHVRSCETFYLYQIRCSRNWCHRTYVDDIIIWATNQKWKSEVMQAYAVTNLDDLTVDPKKFTWSGLGRCTSNCEVRQYWLYWPGSQLSHSRHIDKRYHCLQRERESQSKRDSIEQMLHRQNSGRCCDKTVACF